jgi:hypothetical protein
LENGRLEQHLYPDRSGCPEGCSIDGASSGNAEAANASNTRVPDDIVYTDNYHSDNELDVSGFRHQRINHSIIFARHKNHINGIENFWNQVE